ncbi:hypothetical protein [Paenibacillus campi]|uniref:hypothetical protein n=1 Tax=Paenibacillus campi TaxID=3106031 RepID=UPI002AFE2E21|nr:hypothetical protein [Paenibacillus sp. SGZ-1014]
MKEASIIKIGSGEGVSKYVYIAPVIAEVSIAVDQMLQASIDPNQSIGDHLHILDSELDAMHLAIRCGESGEVIKQECVAAIARLAQIYVAAGDQDGGTQ